MKMMRMDRVGPPRPVSTTACIDVRLHGSTTLCFFFFLFALCFFFLFVLFFFCSFFLVPLKVWVSHPSTTLLTGSAIPIAPFNLLTELSQGGTRSSWVLAIHASPIVDKHGYIFSPEELPARIVPALVCEVSTRRTVRYRAEIKLTQ